MREILFRGKDESGKWAYGRLAYDVMSLGTPDAIVDKNGITVIDPDTVGQYTGVCDKHGNKIFEGDTLFIGLIGYRGGVDYVVDSDGGGFVACNCLDTHVLRDVADISVVVGNQWDGKRTSE